MTVPSYSRVVLLIEQAVRARLPVLRYYDEYLIALGRALARRVDDGEMPPEAMFRVADHALREAAQMITQDSILLMQNVQRAEQEAAREAELLAGLLAVWAASATASANSYNALYHHAPIAAPLHCTAYPSGTRYAPSVQVQCR
jgi:hypothetical protein